MNINEVWKIVAEKEYGKSDELDRKFDIIEREAFEFAKVSELFWMLENVIVFYDLDEVYEYVLQDALDNRDLVNSMWEHFTYKQKHTFMTEVLEFNYIEGVLFNNYYKFIFEI